MKSLKSISAGIIAAGVIAAMPMSAQANLEMQFLDINTNTWISLDVLNTIANPQFYFAETTLSNGSTLANNDIFTETFSITTSNSSLGGVVDFASLAGDYRFDVSLTGSIGNLAGGSVTLNNDDSVTVVGTPVFDVTFSSATLNMYDNVNNSFITSLVFLSGAGSEISLVAGTLIGDITINSLLGPACLLICDTYVRDVSGNSIIGENILTITTGSARFLGFEGSDFLSATLRSNFQDNGESTTFMRVPEPGSLALLGLGLVGLGAIRRRKLAA